MVCLKKTVSVIVLIAVLAGGISSVIFLKSKLTDNTQQSDTMDTLTEAAAFDMIYSDRLAGVPVTDYYSDSSTIEVSYGDAGFIRKTLGSADDIDNRTNLTESEERIINGNKVTLMGTGGKYYLATWKNNSFSYVISINDTYEGVSFEDMSDYISSTR